MSAKSFLSGFLIGGIAAGITTLLTTPYSGKEVRKVCSDNGKAFLQHIQELKIDLNEIKDSVKTVTVEGKTVLSDFIKDLKLSIETWQEEVKPHQELLQQELDELQSTINELENDLK
ncbi:YtxH domain-containing protein [Niallia sp. FSL W8-0635]|uniref:YtxH domain-containing protein n=1 Tax=Niallia sp. FSL W8-0635 TaxID=2975337 RepID=UPI0009D32874|nr:Gas vesicle protein [Mycobacteroides abscessus subsp. abscessus]HEO8421487.1 YtxH domain-containing protein [Yersinia enterocolitica]